jgi:hypothetical protein
MPSDAEFADLARRHLRLQITGRERAALREVLACFRLQGHLWPRQRVWLAALCHRSAEVLWLPEPPACRSVGGVVGSESL